MRYRNSKTGAEFETIATVSGGDWFPMEPAPAAAPAEPPADETATEPVEPAPAAAPAVGRRARNGG